MKWLLLIISLIPMNVLANEYAFKVDSIYDGDTIKGTAQIWVGLKQYTSVRINGIDTPEIRTKNKCEKKLGLKAKLALIDFIGDSQVVLSNIKNGKYAGRVLGDISVNGKDAASYMLQAGYARIYNGGKRESWCKY